MPIETTKPLKNCKFCGKDYANLATHIINSHPSIVEQLDESAYIPTQNTTPLPLNVANGPPQRQHLGTDIDTMVREKLNTMLNIKIMEMLSSNKDVSLMDIKQSLEPPKTTSLKELKEFHDLVYSNNNNGGNEENGNQWLDLINNALPIVSQMLPKKREELEKNDRYKPIEDGRVATIRPISEEVARDTNKSGIDSEEPRIIVPTEQQNNIGSDGINQGNK